MKKRALISVSNKENITTFAEGLVALDYEILSTGGTLKLLKEAGIQATAVDDVTGFREILDSRVKILHTKIHGGLLAKKDDANHEAQLPEHEIGHIDVVVVNLYPFKETLRKPDATPEDIIENIDIGGPTMLRAAAKNFEDVLVVVDPSDYDSVLGDLNYGVLSYEDGKQLAGELV